MFCQKSVGQIHARRSHVGFGAPGALCHEFVERTSQIGQGVVEIENDATHQREDSANFVDHQVPERSCFAGGASPLVKLSCLHFSD